NSWMDSLFNPRTGERQRPLDIDELLLNEEVPEPRRQELLARYGPDFGKDWKEAWRRNPNLVAYLTSYGGYPRQTALRNLLEKAKRAGPDEAARAQALVQKWTPDPTKAQRGKSATQDFQALKKRLAALVQEKLIDKAADHVPALVEEAV